MFGLVFVYQKVVKPILNSLKSKKPEGEKGTTTNTQSIREVQIIEKPVIKERVRVIEVEPIKTLEPETPKLEEKDGEETELEKETG